MAQSKGRIVPADFCVAAAAYPSGDTDVKAEVELVKSCILYAGHIRLYSPTAALVFQMVHAVKSMSRAEATELVLETMKHTGTLSPALEGDGGQQLKSAALNPITKGWTKKKKRYAKGQRTLKKLIDDGIENLVETALRWRTTPSYLELDVADRSGVLTFAHDDATLDPIEQLTDFTIAAQGGQERPGAPERDRDFKERMLGNLLRSVEGNEEYPLLDERVRSLVRASSESGFFRATGVGDRSKPTGLGRNVFHRLPVPDAPMDELLDLRAELESAVSRFRSGLITASSEIRSVQWDTSFESEASAIYLKYVAPALDELEEILDATPALHSFFQKFASGIKATGVAGGLSLIINNLFELAPFLVGSIGLVGASATFAADQIRARQEQLKRTRENDWLLVYNARERLEEG